MDVVFGPEDTTRVQPSIWLKTPLTGAEQHAKLSTVAENPSGVRVPIYAERRLSFRYGTHWQALAPQTRPAKQTGRKQSEADEGQCA